MQHYSSLGKCKWKPQSGTMSYLLEWLLFKYQEKQMLMRMWRKGKPCEPWNVNWCSHYGKKYGRFLKKLKVELSYDPTIPLLYIYPNKIKSLSGRDFCITALSPINQDT